MPIAGPFYWAWVDPSETNFNSSHYRMDEYIFSAKRTLAEGEKPLLEIEIQNPHIGILSPTRKYWAWLSWDTGASIVPLFFGRVVGTPVQIFEEVITLQLVADPTDYKQRVQRVAETLKYRPFYDQVFIDVAQRDDPNTILEAHAKVWDVDSVSHTVTANDIIIGADGNEDFTADDHFYDSMTMTVKQPPATAILMDASVSWTQTARGIVDVTNGYRKFESIGGDGLIGDWPKPLSDIGGGYKVYFSDAFDTAGANEAIMTSSSYNWQNKEREHSDGDSLSKNLSWSVPMGGQIAAQRILTYDQQIGYLDPFTVDANGDPAPTNIPPKYNDSTGYVLSWSVSAALTLKYEAQRSRTERAIFLVRADTQPVLTHPELSQESEVMTKSGADVGKPIINLLNWTTIAGTAISLGQIIFPDNPSIPGGKSVQICVTPGTAGTVEPNFSDIPGFTTNDGSVIWSSLGVATPPDNAVDWTAISHVNAGAIILPKKPFYVSLSTLLLPGTHTVPPSAVPIAEGTYIQNNDGSFSVCTFAGVMGPLGNSAIFTSLGNHLPSGTTFFIATTAGVTGPKWLIPPFNETLHATTTDGSVVWTCIGSGDIPVGGVPGDTHSPTYFATDRGLASLEYLAALVRAKLLFRARCIEINFDCEYGRGINITTRKTVTLHDPRIAAGIAVGKVKGTVLTVSDTGVANCTVTLACCAGKGNAVDEASGDPTYVANGYANEGYQSHVNVTVVLPTTTDLGYAPPVYVVSDDGISFPLTREMIVVTDTYHQGKDVSGEALEAMAKSAELGKPQLGMTDYARQRAQIMLGANSLANLLKANPSWLEYQLKPVNNGPFHKVYNIKFTNLTVPMGIDLESSIIT